MLKSNNIAFFLTVFILMTGASAFAQQPVSANGGAALVVDTDFSGSSAPSARLVDDLPLSKVVTRSWSGTSLLFSGSVNTSTRFYGGTSASAESTLSPKYSKVLINKTKNRVVSRISKSADVGATKARVFYFWDRDDFQNPGGISSFAFDGTANSWLSVKSGKIRDLGDSGGFRFVIRETDLSSGADTYYVANQTSLDQTGLGMTGVLFGNTADLKWAPFDPANFALFDDDDGNLGFGTLEFSPRTFSNVTGVGLIGNASRPAKEQNDGKTTKVYLGIEDFQAMLTDNSDVPRITINTGLTVAEGDTDAIISSKMLKAEYPDDAAGEITYTLTAATANGTLYLSGDALNVSRTFTQDNIDNGLLTYNHDGGESTSDSFGFELADGGEDGALPVSGTFNITVTPVNDPPEVDAGIANRSTWEGVKFYFRIPADAFTDGDGDGLAHGATLAGGEGLPSWLSFAGTTFSGTPDDPDVGTVSIEVTATDPDGESVTTSFDLTVTPVNDPPQMITNNFLTVNQGDTDVIDNTVLRATDVDNSDDRIIYTVTQAPAHGSLSLGSRALGVGGTFTQANINNEDLRYFNDMNNAPRFRKELELSQIDGESGIVFGGEKTGWAISSAGDVNDDGFEDILIGSPYADGSPDKKDSGVTYLVYGGYDVGSDGVPIDLASLGNRGVVINGAAAGDMIGYFVSAAGDVNGDGVGDILIGAPGVDVSPDTENSGATYLIYGGADGFLGSGTPRNLADLKRRDGVVIYSDLTDDFSGISVSAVGDVNENGFGDILIGATQISSGHAFPGTSYLIYGGPGGFLGKGGSRNLANLGANGVVINGVATGDITGLSVSGVGDVNGDEIEDIFIGAPGVGVRATGAGYLIFGGKGGFLEPGGSRNLANLGANGVLINGAAEKSMAGYSVSGAGDVNDDDVGDILIGVPGADVSYLIYGKSTWPETIRLAKLGTDNGVVINGDYTLGFSASGAGDVNGDAIEDILIAAPHADVAHSGKENSGVTYLIYGGRDGLVGSGGSIDLPNLYNNGMVAINGDASYDHSGYSVSSADINGDNLKDILIGAAGWRPNDSYKNSAYNYVVFGEPESVNVGVDFFDFEVTDFLATPQLSRFEIKVIAAP